MPDGEEKLLLNLILKKRDEYVVALSMRLFLNKNILEMIRVCFKFLKELIQVDEH